MAEESRIAWTRSTFNPWIGCTKVSPGCDHCYASVATPARTLKVEWGAGKPRHRTSASNWKLPLRWNEAAPHTSFAGRKDFWPVFCSSLADVFDNEVPDQWRMDLFTLIANTPNLTWLLLTKRIGNVEKMATRDGLMFEMLATRAWLGATIVNQAEADRDIPKLLATTAAKRFVSYEPALGPINFRWTDWAHEASGETYREYLARKGTVDQYEGLRGISWVIVGGESDQPGMRARPFAIEWARSTVQQCKTAGVPVFVKQMGSHPQPLSEVAGTFHKGEYRQEDRAGADPAEWPEDLRVQEFPQ
jgi:protein gp37